MTLTLKEGVNLNSLTVQHSIVLQATSYLLGREGSLETEKKIYIMMAIIDSMVNEDIIEMCNEDERGLPEILLDDLEPFFVENVLSTDGGQTLFDYLTNIVLEHCYQVWENQHSMVGVIDAALTALASMDAEDKKEVMKEMGEKAAQIAESRSETMVKKTEEVNNKLEDLVKQYQKKNIDNTIE